MINYKKVIVCLNLWRIFPVYFLCKHTRFSKKIEADIDAWKRINSATESNFWSFADNIINKKVFRNVLLMRLHRNPIVFIITRFLFKPLENLYINMPPENIGGGLYFQHGFATIVAAKQIGENCSINQQVTIGYNGKNAPVIKDGVTICAGAIVVGNVTLGNNSIVGAGAVVTHDVDDNTIVAGVPAVPIKMR